MEFVFGIVVGGVAVFAVVYWKLGNFTML